MQKLHTQIRKQEKRFSKARFKRTKVKARRFGVFCAFFMLRGGIGKGDGFTEDI